MAGFFVAQTPLHPPERPVSTCGCFSSGSLLRKKRCSLASLALVDWLAGWLGWLASRMELES